MFPSSLASNPSLKRLGSDLQRQSWSMLHDTRSKMRQAKVERFNFFRTCDSFALMRPYFRSFREVLHLFSLTWYVYVHDSRLTVYSLQGDAISGVSN